MAKIKDTDKRFRKRNEFKEKVNPAQISMIKSDFKDLLEEKEGRRFLSLKALLKYYNITLHFMKRLHSGEIGKGIPPEISNIPWDFSFNVGRRYNIKVLSDDDVREIRRLYFEEYKTLGEIIQIMDLQRSRQAVSYIVNKRSYKHVKSK